jgi:hypothetical protein
MARGLPPDSQAAMAWSCGDALAAGVAAARLRAFAVRSCFTIFAALRRFSFASVRSSCFEPDALAAASAFA